MHQIIDPYHLPQISAQILKKLVHKCLYHFQDQNEILCNNQHGFRNNHSAIHMLIDITEKKKKMLQTIEY